MKFKNNLLIGFLILATFISVLIATYSLSAIFKFPFNDWLKSIPSKISKVEIKNKLPSAYIVQSGSMEPSIKTGSIVISYPQLIYAPGDVITYSKGVNDKNLITHRVEVRNFPEGVDKAPVYKTSGDANEDFDSGEVKHDQVVGKVVTTIPYLGYLANVAKKPYGFILIVIVPATIIIYEELKSLLKEISNRSRFLNKFRKKNIKPSAPFQGESFKAGRTIVSYVLILFVPFFGASLVFTALASSYFSDNETSTGNVFQASEFFCNTSENADLVINEVFYDVDTTHNGQGSENKWEWVELFNSSTSPIDISGWIIEDGNSSDTFPSGITEIPPCGFAMVSNASEAELEDQTNDGGQWTIPDGTIFVTLSSFIGNGLANGGDIVILKNADPAERDRMSFGTKLDGFTPNCIGSCPSVASGHSLEREPDGKDTGVQGDFIDRTVPSPGS